MEPQVIQSIVEKVLQQIGANPLQSRQNEVPIAVSARHIHLSVHDIGVLFGAPYDLHIKKNLSQPNQFAAEETVTIAGPKKAIENVRVLGPARHSTQIEVSRTDAVRLGLSPPVRESGNLAGSSPVTVIGPKGSLYLQEGLIIAQAHIHMPPNDATRFGVTNGEYVQVRVRSERPITLGNVLVRVSSSYRLEMHVDTDEANAGAIQAGQTGIVIINGGVPEERNSFFPLGISGDEKIENTTFQDKLLSQVEVQKSKGSVIRIYKSTIVTPLARDAARDLGKKIEIIDS